MDLFKETAKKSMAELLVESSEVFREREKKIKKATERAEKHKAKL